jgi:hypothetical protein
MVSSKGTFTTVGLAVLTVAAANLAMSPPDAMAGANGEASMAKRTIASPNIYQELSADPFGMTLTDDQLEDLGPCFGVPGCLSSDSLAKV